MNRIRNIVLALVLVFFCLTACNQVNPAAEVMASEPDITTPVDQGDEDEDDEEDDDDDDGGN